MCRNLLRTLSRCEVTTRLTSSGNGASSSAGSQPCFHVAERYLATKAGHGDGKDRAGVPLCKDQAGPLNRQRALKTAEQSAINSVSDCPGRIAFRSKSGRIPKKSRIGVNRSCCWPVLITRQLAQGTHQRALITGTILMASGRVPTTQTIFSRPPSFMRGIPRVQETVNGLGSAGSDRSRDSQAAPLTSDPIRPPRSNPRSARVPGSRSRPTAPGEVPARVHGP